MNPEKELQNKSRLNVEWYENAASCACKARYHKKQVWEYHFRLTCNITDKNNEKESGYHSPAKLSMFSHYNDPGVAIHITYPGFDTAGLWRPDAGLQKSLPADWLHPCHTNISHGAPVLCYFGYENENILTISLSETRYDLEIRGAINEETGELHADIMIPAPSPVFDFVLRIDESRIPFFDALSEVSSWWDRHLKDNMMPASDIARQPMYSTWYTYHQKVDANTLLAQCKEASLFGMKAVILDDGWQTNDSNRGYKYCGDWKVMPEKFPDFKAFVKKLHDTDMKCLVWFSVPYMGDGAKSYDEFSDMLLHFDREVSAGILDPRYPKVRKYLIGTYVDFLDKYDIDGFKFDFIDSFSEYEDTPVCNETMDYVRVQDAVYALMIAVSDALRTRKPDILIEFRQNYIGPSIQRFGNMFRVGDCPLSDVNNRVGIADLKVMSPSLCVHSDMLMWHPGETPEKVALHLISCIFSTLQISVDLSKQSKENKAVLSHYLDFAKNYRKVLQQGKFSAYYPLQNYPVLESFLEGTLIQCCYSPAALLHVHKSYGSFALKELHLLNGSGKDRVDVILPAGRYTGRILTPTGLVLEEISLQHGGNVSLKIPSGGRALLARHI